MPLPGGSALVLLEWVAWVIGGVLVVAVLVWLLFRHPPAPPPDGLPAAVRDAVLAYVRQDPDILPDSCVLTRWKHGPFVAVGQRWYVCEVQVVYDNLLAARLTLMACLHLVDARVPKFPYALIQRAGEVFPVREAAQPYDAVGGH